MAGYSRWTVHLSRRAWGKSTSSLRLRHAQKRCAPASDEAAAGANDEEKKERHPNQRRNHADLNLGCRWNKADEAVGSEQKSGARQRRRKQHRRRPVADEWPDQVRYDEPEKADQTCH